MKEEIIEKILRKMKETVSENNYKLALAITGRRPGKIRDVLMSSKDGETLLEYIENLQSQLKEKEEVIKKFEKYLNDCVSELENNYGTSSIQNAINTGIVDITKVILSKFNEILSKGENK